MGPSASGVGAAGAQGLGEPGPGAGLTYRCPVGALAKARFLTADLLADTTHLSVFRRELHEADSERVFRLTFALLPQCSARMRMRTEAVDQNRWRFPREGAWLKPMAGGDRVDLARVDRVTIAVLRKSEAPLRFCLTPLTAGVPEPARLNEPLLPQGPLLDELGQSRLTTWTGRSKDAAEVTARLEAQLDAAPGQRWHGLRAGRHHGVLRGPGIGVDLAAREGRPVSRHLQRAPRTAPCQLPEGELHQGVRSGELARPVGHDRPRRAATPRLQHRGQLVRVDHRPGRGVPLRPSDAPRFTATPLVFRDFPDVYHPAFEQEAGGFAETLRETRDDPALIGYFLMNEPTRGFAKETPAAGLLFNSPRSATRRALGDFVKGRYASEAALADAWGAGTTFAALAEGEWTRPLTPRAEEDLAAFSEVIVERYFGTLSRACREVDPHHLNPGIRCAGVPPAWAVPGMRTFDVFSMNCYRPRILAEDMERVHALLKQPVMIGE